MIFHSLDYLIFLVVVLGLYWSLPARWRNLLLVAASCVFYGYVHPWILLPFAATTLIDYFVARGIAARPDRKATLVAISVVSNVALLGIFKYYNFFAENVAATLGAMHVPVSLPVLHVVLPAGISFYTFQSIGYVVDVARGHVPACRSFRDYALFVSFFPQLVAGPIQRATHLLPQIPARRTVDPNQVTTALCLMAWGFFKKLVIADNVALTANKIFALEHPSFPILWTGVFAFCIQIYADFSGYTDIARGTARLFGFDLTRNFNHPYLAESPSDFWSRWHISLSTWFRDYLYIPLGGSRGSEGRTVFHLLFVFFVTGLWHGASWNFIIWGLYYAVLTIAYRFADRWMGGKFKPALPVRLGKIILMFAFTNIGWLIFREQDTARLWQHLTLLPGATPGSDWRVAAFLSMLTLLFASPLILHTLWDVALRERLEHWTRWDQSKWLAETAVSMVLVAALSLLRSDSSQDFIYFQF